jgi:hypothetical protein
MASRDPIVYVGTWASRTHDLAAIKADLRAVCAEVHIEAVKAGRKLDAILAALKNRGWGEPPD